MIRMVLPRQTLPWTILLAGLLLCTIAYIPGLSGGWLFDDFPNIVDNRAVHIEHLDLSSLVNAALSSPSSEFKRPLASLTFALNYLVAGLDAPSMKVTNLAIHLANGLLVFLLLRSIIGTRPGVERKGAGRLASVIASAWLLLPINVTSVLYVVQRMESLANLFVLLGLIAYVHGRRRMLTGRDGLLLSVCGVVFCTAIGSMAKETAIMLPLYALLTEMMLFRWRRSTADGLARTDYRVVALFLIVLALPLLAGGIWLVPTLLRPETWATRTFTLGTRLLSESRIVVDYIRWILFPTPEALSFYHDDFQVSKSVLEPWTTLASIAALAGLVFWTWVSRRTHPLTALGISWYLGCHLLTGTVLPLELVYEHRNYFASIGLLLAFFDIVWRYLSALQVRRAVAIAALGLFLVWQGGLTFMTAQSWGNPLALAQEIAYRGPDSPRAQYELGRTYIIYSHYDPSSPFVKDAQQALERAAALKGASILPEQALIFMNSRMNLPVERRWWDSMAQKLRAQSPTVQDESALDALSRCLREKSCHFPPQDLLDAYLAALAHPGPSARLLGMYSNFAWSNLGDKPLAIRIQKQAVRAAPNEASYRIGLARMSTATGDFTEAERQIDALKRMSIGGGLDHDIDALSSAMNDAKHKATTQ
jgi:protein O-mannosyl-transferase